MISLVLFSLLIGNGMAAPLYPETFNAAEPFPSALETAAHQVEDQESRQIANIAFRLFSLKLIYSVAMGYFGILSKYQIACILTGATCAPVYNANEKIDLLADANLRNLTDGDPNLFPYVLDPEQQINYLKSFNPNFPAMVKNDAYLGYSTPPFTTATPILENDQFTLALLHNLMVNIDHQPVTSSLNFMNQVSVYRPQNIH